MVSERKVITMTQQEVIKRLGRLDIRDAEPDDYIALYKAIEWLKNMEKCECGNIFGRPSVWSMD